MKIYLEEPIVTVEDGQAVYDEIRRYPFSTASPTVDEFERAMRSYFGFPDCVATNSGTSALHMALLASGINSREKVFLPALTFVGSANAIRMCRAEPIFTDVDPDTWNIVIPPKFNIFNRPIMGIDLYGNPMSIHKTGLEIPKVIDSSEALGSITPMPHIANFSCYSFNGNKILTTGAGGLVVGKDLSVIRILIRQGVDENKNCVIPGYNNRMTGMCAALGLSQLKRFDRTLAKKRKINEIYQNELPKLKFQKEGKSFRSNFWLTGAIFPENIDIQNLQNKLLEMKIPTRRIFKPLNQEPAYRNTMHYNNADYIYKHGLCLPSSVRNTEKGIMWVCKIIKQLLF